MEINALSRRYITKVLYRSLNLYVKLNDGDLGDTIQRFCIDAQKKDVVVIFLSCVILMFLCAVHRNSILTNKKKTF